MSPSLPVVRCFLSCNFRSKKNLTDRWPIFISRRHQEKQLNKNYSTGVALTAFGDVSPADGRVAYFVSRKFVFFQQLQPQWFVYYGNH